jgi:hypothetical protein
MTVGAIGVARILPATPRRFAPREIHHGETGGRAWGCSDRTYRSSVAALERIAFREHPPHLAPRPTRRAHPGRSPEGSPDPDDGLRFGARVLQAKQRRRRRARGDRARADPRIGGLRRSVCARPSLRARAVLLVAGRGESARGRGLAAHPRLVGARRVSKPRARHRPGHRDPRQLDEATRRPRHPRDRRTVRERQLAREPRRRTGRGRGESRVRGRVVRGGRGCDGADRQLDDRSNRRPGRGGGRQPARAREERSPCRPGNFTAARAAPPHRRPPPSPRIAPTRSRCVRRWGATSGPFRT